MTPEPDEPIFHGACPCAGRVHHAALPCARSETEQVREPRRLQPGRAPERDRGVDVRRGDDPPAFGERGPNLMTRRVQDQTDGAIFWKITSGNTRSGMPTFSLLPELQRWQLVNYLRSDAQDLPK